MSVRLYHPTARNATAVFSHNKRPLKAWNKKTRRKHDTPLWCALCGKFHNVKTYHVKVDSEGFAIVSDEVWKMLKRHNTAGFELANEVSNPPPIVIGGDLPPTRPDIVELGD
jgi:hypothetical protein